MSIISRIFPGAAILVLGLAICSVSGAADKATMLEQRFKAADKDQDGKLSKNEAEQGMPRVYKNFETIDKDKDGYVTPGEIKALMDR